MLTLKELKGRLTEAITLSRGAGGIANPEIEANYIIGVLKKIAFEDRAETAKPVRADRRPPPAFRPRGYQ